MKVLLSNFYLKGHTGGFHPRTEKLAGTYYEALPVGSPVARLKFKTSRVGVYKSFT